MIHLGFYDDNSGGGAYECHTNIFMLASDFGDAKAKVKEMKMVKERKMHIDSMQMVEVVDGHAIIAQADASLSGQTIIRSEKG